MKSIAIQTIFRNFPTHEVEGSSSKLRLVKTDQKRLQQVLLNLFSNAIKFTDRDGQIVVLVELIQEDLDDPGMLSISVEDNGLGIKEEDKGKLFKQFSSFKDPNRNINTKGIGLGLVICKMIVEKFNDCIGFESTYNEGSKFYYDFELEDFSASDY